MSKEAFSIFDILREQGVLKEAEGDENTSDGASTTDNNNEADNGENNETGEEDIAGGNDDDFDIDASLDDGDDSGENPESSPSDSDDGGSGSDSADGGNNSDEEVNDDNTDIFSSLSAEEQQIKIKELKGLYQQMYTSCDELLDRINNLEFTEDSLPIMNRITYALYDLKKYISEYIISIFPRKSFIENDIAFNRFLMILNSVKDILSRYQKKSERDDS